MRWFNGAASLSIFAEKFRPSRQLMMVMPWSPRVPLTSTASPGRICATEVHALGKGAHAARVMM